MLRLDRSRGTLLLLGASFVLLALWPALAADDVSSLRTALTLGWTGLLLMLVALVRPARLRRHDAHVSDVRPPMDDAAAFAPYAVASCGCGWEGPARTTVQEAFDDAATHTSRVASKVERPLG